MEPKHISEVLREWWEERAAIRQYEGGETREEAERNASKELEYYANAN